MARHFFRAMNSLHGGVEVSFRGLSDILGKNELVEARIFGEQRISGPQGKKRAAILFPGMGCDAGYFFHQISYLKSLGIPSLAINPRGIGTSTYWQEAPWEYMERAARDANAIVGQTWLADAELHLVGHNIGAGIAAIFARQRLGRISSYTGIAPLLGNPIELFPKGLALNTVRRFLENVPETGPSENVPGQLKLLLRAAEKFSRVKTRGDSERAKAINKEFWAVMRENARAVLAAMQGSIISAEEVKDAFIGIDAPIRVVTGARDLLVRPDVGIAAKELNPNAMHILLPSASHFPHLEEPEVVNFAIETAVGQPAEYIPRRNDAQAQPD